MDLNHPACQRGDREEAHSTEVSLRKPQVNTNTPPLLSARDCISIATLQDTWKQFTFLLTFFLIVWLEKQRVLAFLQRGKKWLLVALYKDGLVPFIRTFTNGVDILLSKMNDGTWERQNIST